MVFYSVSEYLNLLITRIVPFATDPPSGVCPGNMRCNMEWRAFGARRLPFGRRLGKEPEVVRVIATGREANQRARSLCKARPPQTNDSVWQCLVRP